jgi:SAM-dependent methyltransferase
MALFKNSHDSHEHSLKTLKLLCEYDSFLDSLQVIADMGTGGGLDAKWWAELTTRDETPEPHNYLVYAVDEDCRYLEPGVADIKNITTISGNYLGERVIPRSVDLMWAHGCLQKARDPLACLAGWKSTMTVNGMLVLSVPQTTYWDHSYSRLIVSSHNHQYFSYNLLNLMYMLAISGFDCRDAYFYREKNTPWLYAAVYATEHEPLPKHATWHDLAERRLVNDTVINSINKYGYARLEDVIVQWLDKDNYLITD